MQASTQFHISMVAGHQYNGVRDYTLDELTIKDLSIGRFLGSSVGTYLHCPSDISTCTTYLGLCKNVTYLNWYHDTGLSVTQSVLRV